MHTNNRGKWNRINSLKINSSIYGHLIFDKGEKNAQWEYTVFSKNGAGKTR